MTLQREPPGAVARVAGVVSPWRCPARSRLEEGGGAKNRIDTLARVAEALGRHLIVSFPEKVPAELKDAVQVS
jgi:hypothetical protein